MQRKVLVATVLLAVVAAALLVGSRPFSLGQEQIPAPRLSRQTDPAANQRLFGRGGLCLAGLPRRSRLRGKQQATGKMEQRVHGLGREGQACEGLLRALLPRIEEDSAESRSLGPAADPKPYRDERCLACHATVAKASEDGTGFPGRRRGLRGLPRRGPRLACRTHGSHLEQDRHAYASRHARAGGGQGWPDGEHARHGRAGRRLRRLPYRLVRVRTACRRGTWITT